MDSTTRTALVLSNVMGAAPRLGLMSWLICGTNSPTRRNSRVNSLVAMRPLGGRAKVEPSTNSGASVRVSWSWETLINRSPSGAKPMPWRLKRVSRARRASDFGKGLSRVRVNVASGSWAGRRMILPVQRS